MANRTVYITVQLSISNPDVTEIFDEEVDRIISEVDYEFKNMENYQISTKISETRYSN